MLEDGIYTKERYLERVQILEKELTDLEVKYNELCNIKFDKEDNGVTITNLKIIFDNGKRLTYDVPTSYNEIYNNNIKHFLEDIDYNKNKQKSIDKAYETIFNKYMEGNVENLIVFPSSSNTGYMDYIELNNSYSLYIFSNKDDNKDIVVMIIEDYLKKHYKDIDSMDFGDNYLKMTFGFYNMLEINDSKIIKRLSKITDFLMNKLIDKNIKKLKINKEKPL